MVALKTLVALALPLVALASPLTETNPAGGCNSGSVQCCNSVQSADKLKSILGLLGILGQVTSQIGLGCTPINVLALGGNSCTQQTVCCHNNQNTDLVGISCTPINISL